MSIRLNIPVLHADMLSYQEELARSPGNSRTLIRVATACYINAKTKIPENHVLKVHFKTLEEMVSGDAHDLQIFRKIESIAAKVKKIFNEYALDSVVRAITQGAPDVRLTPAAPSPAAPLMTLSHPSHLPDFPRKISQLEVSLFETNGKFVDLTSHAERVSQCVDKLDKTFVDFMTKNFSENPKTRSQLDEFRAILRRYQIELAACQATEGAINARLTSGLEPRMKVLEMSLKTAKEDLAREREIFKKEAEESQARMDVFKAEMCSKLVRLEGVLMTASLYSKQKFFEFPVKKWSTIVPTKKDPIAVLFSAPKPAWGHLFHLKVEKQQDKIGLYLCCNTAVPRCSFKLDYQLMVKRGDAACCASVVFRTEFGVEKAWGLTEFTTPELLKKAAGYSPDEDLVTFGCMVFPISLLWGSHAVDYRIVPDEKRGGALGLIATTAALPALPVPVETPAPPGRLGPAAPAGAIAPAALLSPKLETKGDGVEVKAAKRKGRKKR